MTVMPAPSCVALCDAGQQARAKHGAGTGQGPGQVQALVVTLPCGAALVVSH
jgi:hypothetical protein